MQDQYIILDKTFDQHATYTLVAWMAPIDTYVTRGEALAILQNDDTQMVVVAPCSGRMAATYFDPGARVLPRSIIGSIRPESTTEQHLGISSGILIATGLILTAMIVFPILSQLRTPAATTNTVNSDTPAITLQPTADTPVASDPEAAESPFQPLQDFFGGSYPAPNEAQVPVATPDVIPTAPSEATDTLTTPQDSSFLSDGISNIDLTNDILTYMDTIHTINLTNRDLLETPVDINIFDSDIMPAYDDLLRQKEELNVLSDQYRNDPALSQDNATLLSMYSSWIDPCITPFEQQRRYIYEGIAPDSDMQMYFAECDNINDVVIEYDPNN